MSLFTLFSIIFLILSLHHIINPSISLVSIVHVLVPCFVDFIQVLFLLVLAIVRVPEMILQHVCDILH